MNNIIITGDARRPFSYVSFNTIVGYIKELIDNDMNNVWASYHHQLLDYMKNRFSRSFLVVEHDSIAPLPNEVAEMDAGRQFYNYLLATGDKYSKLIEFQEYKLNELLDLKNEITRTGSKTDYGINNESPTEDSTLRKFNDTPLSGNNPNLLDDTYLTESERNTITAGERESEFTNNSASDSSDIIRDDIKALSIISTIRENIRNYYLEWIKDIDRELFTYIPLDL